MADLARPELIANKSLTSLTKADEAEQKIAGARDRYDLLLTGSRKEEIERARQRWAAADAKRRQLRGGFRKEDIAQAKSAVEASRARLKQIRSQLDETVIRAPVDALVEALEWNRGIYSARANQWRHCCALGSLWVRAYLPEAHWAMCGRDESKGARGFHSP